LNKGFDRLFELVLADAALRDDFLTASDLPALYVKVLALAKERGWELREQDLDAIVNSNRRSWLERWVNQ